MFSEERVKVGGQQGALTLDDLADTNAGDEISAADGGVEPAGVIPLVNKSKNQQHRDRDSISDHIGFGYGCSYFSPLLSGLLVSLR